MNKLLLIVGESGAGKTAVSNYLEENFGLKILPSYTTRPPRYEGEKGHIFISEKEFDNIDAKDMIAPVKYHGHRYCATKQQVEENDIYVIDLDGLKNMQRNYKGNKNIKIIYIKASQEERKNRMIERGDSEDFANSRIRNDFVSFCGVKDIADLVVENNTTIAESTTSVSRIPNHNNNIANK